MPKKMTVAELFLAYKIATSKRMEIVLSRGEREGYGRALEASVHSDQLLSQCDVQIEVPDELLEFIMNEPAVNIAIRVEKLVKG